MPASTVLRTAAGLQALLGGLALVHGSTHNADTSACAALLAWGVGLLIVGLVGPVRIVLKGPKLPPEILSVIRVHAVGLSALGGSLLVGAAVGTPMAAVVAWMVTGLGILLQAWLGLFRLSKRMPPTFYIGEMLAIVKSAGLLGKRAESAADQAFRRWSPGTADGAAVGAEAPDGPVVTLTGETRQLHSYLLEDAQPVVLNFGSYSCPHHRKRMPELLALQAHWQAKGVRFLTVYIAEAHPEDGWMLTDQYATDAEYTKAEDFCFFYAKTLADRQAMAQRLITAKALTMDVVLDTLNNTLLTAYNAWPIRLYVVQAGKVMYSGAQGPFGYDVPGVDAILKALSQS